MCYRLYAEFDTIAVRTARRYANLKTALTAAKKIHANCGEIRELMPTGQERLVDIVIKGEALANPTQA